VATGLRSRDCAPVFQFGPPRIYEYIKDTDGPSGSAVLSQVPRWHKTEGQPDLRDGVQSEQRLLATLAAGENKNDVLLVVNVRLKVIDINKAPWEFLGEYAKQRRRAPSRALRSIPGSSNIISPRADDERGPRPIVECGA